jgi:hypothetical protein
MFRLEDLFPEVDPDAKCQCRLEPGEQYEWWEEHRLEYTNKIAIVHVCKQFRVSVLIEDYLRTKSRQLSGI